MQRATFVTTVIALSIAACFVGSALVAQDFNPGARGLLPRVTLAGAFDARNNGRGDPEMYLGLASAEWETRRPGLAVRLDAIYARRARIEHVDAPCVDCDYLGGLPYLSSKVTAAGGMIGARYAIGATRSLQPYALAGVGLLRSHDKYFAGRTESLACIDTCIMLAIARANPQRNERPLSAAAQVGAGVAYSLGWVSLIAEARYFVVDYANTRALNGAVPIALGVRF